MATDPAMVIRIAANLDELRKNLSQGQNLIETTVASMKKLTTSLQGEKLTQSARNITAAIHEIGGVTKLTVAEAARLEPTLAKAIAKLEVMGQVVPDLMRQTHAELKKVADQSERTAAATQTMGSRIKETALGYAAGMVSLQAFEQVGRKVVQFFTDSVGAAVEAEKAQSRMVGALTAQGTALPGVIKLYENLASSFQRTTVFADETVKDAITTFVQLGQVAPDSMGRALTAATDLASAMQMDLESAATLVSKALEGNDGALKRLGITLDATRVKAEGADYIFAALNERFGGAAQREITTYAGQLQQLTNQWEEFQEQTGKSILNTGTLQVGLVVLGGVLKNLASDISGVTNALDIMWRSNGNVLLAALGFLSGKGAAIAGEMPAPLKLVASHGDVDTASRDVVARRALEVSTAARKKAADAAADLAKKTAASAKDTMKAIDGMLNAGMDGLRKMPDYISQFRMAGKVEEARSKAINAIADAVERMNDAVNRTDPRKLAGMAGGVSGTDIAATFVAPTLGTLIKGHLQNAARAFPQMLASAIVNGQQIAQAVKATVVTVGGDIAGEWGKSLAKSGSKMSGALGSLFSAGAAIGLDFLMKGVTALVTKFQNVTKGAREDFAGGLGFDSLDALYKRLQSMGAEGSRLANIGLNVIGKQDKAANEKWMKDVQAFMAKQTADQDRLAASMEKYGFTWEQMGLKARNARLGDIANDLMETFRVLTDESLGGFAPDEVLRRMAGDFSSMVQQAKRSATEIPAALKPTLQRLADMGLLLDENGAALADLSSLQFAQTLTQGFDRVVTAIDKMTNALLGVPAALDPTMEALGGGAARGGAFWRPQPVPTASASGGNAQIHVHTYLDGREVAETIVPYIPGAVQSYGAA